jgi:hypothetical protein
MSTLIGTESERWSLSRAIDALSESARQAGHPGSVWLAGLVYTMTVGLGLGWDGGLSHSFARPGVRWSGEWMEALRRLPAGVFLVLSAVPCLGLMFLPLFRMSVGLARIGPAAAWKAACGDRRTPRLRTVWAAGKGLGFAAFGLWMQLALMILGAALLGSLPISVLAHVIGHSSRDPQAAAFLGALLVPILIVLVGYAIVLSVLNQLALHSLAHNRRGVYSALLHGWRIMRNDGWATARTVLVDLLLFVTVAMIWGVLTGGGEALGEPLQTIGAIVKFLLTGFAGVARAGYWARAYRALGGLSPDDGVPGLQA